MTRSIVVVSCFCSVSVLFLFFLKKKGGRRRKRKDEAVMDEGLKRHSVLFLLFYLLFFCFLFLLSFLRCFGGPYLTDCAVGYTGVFLLNFLLGSFISHSKREDTQSHHIARTTRTAKYETHANLGSEYGATITSEGAAET